MRPFGARVVARLVTTALLAAALPVAAAHGAVEPATTGTITGTVTVPDGYDVTLVTVQTSGSAVLSTQPDPTGSYSIAAPPGLYSVRFIAPPGLYTKYWDDSPDGSHAKQVTVTAGVVSDHVDAALDVGATISGTIRVPAGFDVTDASVRAQGRTTFPIHLQTVAADGSYAIDSLPPGSYAIRVTAGNPALVSGWWPGPSATITRRVDVTAGQVVRDIDVDLPVGARIAGRVSVPAGQSAADSTVLVVRSDGREAKRLVLGEAGTFVAEGLDADTYELRYLGTASVGAEYWEDAVWPEDATPIPLTLGQSVDGVELVAGERADLAVTGGLSGTAGVPFDVVAEVTAHDGRPATGEVEFRLDGELLGVAPVVDDEARYPVQLPVGLYTVRATYSGSARLTPCGAETPISVTAPSPATITSIEPAGGAYSGGTRVTIRGHGMGSATAVTFGGAPDVSEGAPGTDLEIVSNQELRVTAPAGPIGTAPVVVTNAGGTSQASPEAVFHNVAVVAQTPVRVVADWSVPPDTVRCVEVAGMHGVPAEATGLMVNVTAVGPSGPGYVVVYPDVDGSGATAAPYASTVNFEPGADVANGTFVALPESGAICYATKGASRAGVLIDLSGFTLDGSGVVLQTPERLLDTRLAAPGLAPTWPRRSYTVEVAGHAGVPDDAAAVLLNITVQGGSGVGNLRMFPSGSPVPGTSVLNYAPGVEKANGAGGGPPPPPRRHLLLVGHRPASRGHPRRRRLRRRGQRLHTGPTDSRP